MCVLSVCVSVCVCECVSVSVCVCMCVHTSHARTALYRQLTWCISTPHASDGTNMMH